MMKTAIALGVLVALAGCSKPERAQGYAAIGHDDKPLIANAVWEGTRTYIFKDGKRVLMGTTKCRGINGGECNVEPASPTRVRNHP